jgi:hypothetical protein
MSSLEQADKEAAAHAKAPRVSIKNINDEIAAVHYSNGHTLAQHAVQTDWHDKSQHAGDVLSAFTIALVVLRNGYMVIGTSAPASPENFDAAFGRKLALDDAMRKLWPILGYQLKQKLHEDYAK